MNNVVTQPIAAKLKEVGWMVETEWIYRQGDNNLWFLVRSDLHLTYRQSHPKEWLPAPNIYELRFHPDGTERLIYENFKDYFDEHAEPENIPGRFVDAGLSWCGFSQWLYAVTASVDELAEILIWVNSNKSGKVEVKEEAWR